MKRYAIIGFGCAGYHAAQAIRRLDRTGEIHVFDRLDAPPFNPMLSTYYAAGKLSRLGAFPFGGLEDIIARLSLHYHGGAAVSRLSASQRTLELEDGRCFPFDAALLATGARALLPPLKGLPDSRVLVMRTFDDAQKLRALLDAAPVQSAVVVGASMVGVKVAELLFDRGVDVTVADGADWLLPLAAFPHVGQEIERRLTEQGLRFAWGAPVQEITPNGVLLANGALLPAQLICLCIGTRAELSLLGDPAGSNPTLQRGRGVIVNGNMETSCPGIYAAGDCCEGTDLQSGETMPIGLWANAAYQGEAAGKAMAGFPQPFPGNIVHNISHFMGLDFIGLGNNRLPGEHVTWGDLRQGPYIDAVVKDGALQCVNMLDCCRLSGVLKNLLLSQLARPGSGLTPVQRTALLRGGVSPEFIQTIGGDPHD